jgi:VWFA-related protein
MRRPSAALILLLAPLSLPCLAAEPPSGEVFSESIDVDVVNVDVFVADRAGKPVHGLGRDDFELRVDGKPVAITNFYAGAAAPAAVPAGGAAAPSPAVPPAGGSIPAGGPRNGERPLTLAIFLDDSNLSVGGRNPTLQRLEGFFRDGLRRRDRVLIARYDGGNVELSLPPAGDPEAVVAELRRATGRNSHGTINTNDWAKALQDFYDAMERRSPPEMDEALSRLHVLSLRREGESHRMLVTLASFVDALGGMPGRKALLYLSGRLTVPSGDSAIRELGERANAAGVTLYGLGAQDDYASILIGTSKLSDVAVPAWLVADLNADLFSGRLQEIVGPTGGFAAVDPSRPALVLERIRADFASYYSLGFSPAAPHDGRRHALQVRVKGRRGLDVRFPAGFTARTREELLAGRTRAALVAGGPPDNPLGLRLAVERDELAREGGRKVSLLVAFPLGRLALRPGRGGEEGKAVLFVAARDSAGRSLPMRRIELPVQVPEERLTAARGGDAAYRLDLELPLGAATLAAGLRDEVGGGESLVVSHYTAGALAPAGAPAHAARPPAPAPPRR